MTDTTQGGTSDGKLCAQCESPFGPEDDKRYSQCSTCRGAAPAVTEVPSDAPVQPGESVFLDVDACQPPPIEERDYYWCGATEDCPFDVTLGGFEFPKSIGRIREDAHGQAVMEPDYRKGVIHRMTEKQKAVVLEHAANRIVRNFRVEELQLLGGGTQTRYRGRLLSKSGNKRRIYTAQSDDRSIGEFVYMMRVRHGSDRPVEDPPTMVPRKR